MRHVRALVLAVDPAFVVTPGVTRKPRSAEYPLQPRSNAYLEPGQFWSVQLRDGRYAAGMVLTVPTEKTHPHMLANTRSFVAGLLDWVGTEPPTAEALAEAPLLHWGEAHVQSIAEAGSPLLGKVGPDTPSNTLCAVSHRAGGMVGLYCNGDYIRPATREEARSLPLIGTWSLTFLRAVAELVFVDGQPVVR